MEGLRSRNITIPGGKLKTPQEEFNIKTTGEFTTKEEIEQVIIRANDSGNWLRVKDVAKVRHTFEEETTIDKSYGERSIILQVSKAMLLMWQTMYIRSLKSLKALPRRVFMSNLLMTSPIILKGALMCFVQTG